MVKLMKTKMRTHINKQINDHNDAVKVERIRVSL